MCLEVPRICSAASATPTGGRVNPFGKPKRSVATFMTVSFSSAAKKKLSKIHLRKAFRRPSRSSDQNSFPAETKITTVKNTRTTTSTHSNTHIHKHVNRKIPHFSFFVFFLSCFMEVLLSSRWITIITMGLFFCFGTTFSRNWNLFWSFGDFLKFFFLPLTLIFFCFFFLTFYTDCF